MRGDRMPARPRTPTRGTPMALASDDILAIQKLIADYNHFGRRR